MFSTEAQRNIKTEADEYNYLRQELKLDIGNKI